MPDVLRLLQAAPNAIRLMDSVKRALNGDQSAIDYLRSEGWWQALEIIQPGAGGIGQQVVHHGEQAVTAIRDALQGNIIEGEYREVLGYDHFVRWIRRQRWGSYVIIGPKGQGKTTLALRLAQVWNNETGWPVEMVNAYPEDRLEFVEPVGTRKFIARIKRLVDLLNPPEPNRDEDDDEDTEPVEPEMLDRMLEPYKRRIIVIDEMSLAVGTSGMDAGRILVRQIMAQARHLNWLIVYIGQLTRMLPQDLLNCDVVFVKKPAGREALTDRQEPLSMDIWERATAAFQGVRNQPEWDHYPDVRAWAYVDCQDMGVGKGYQGMMPFSRPSEEDDD